MERISAKFHSDICSDSFIAARAYFPAFLFSFCSSLINRKENARRPALPRKSSKLRKPSKHSCF